MIKLLSRRWYIIVLVLIIGIVLYFQNQSAKVKALKSKEYVVKKQDLKDTLSLSGSVDAEEKATLTFPSAGKVVWVGVKEGDIVKKNQTVASMDTRDINMRIQKYLNTYSKTRAVFDQIKDDNDGTQQFGLTTETRDEARRLIDEAQSDLSNSVLDLQIQNLARESSYLQSPIDGIVTKAPVLTAGVYVPLPAQAQYEMINPDTIYFSANVDQTDVVKLTKGMLANIVFDAYPDETVTGTVLSISFTPNTDETGTVYGVKIQFGGHGHTYKLGMTGDADFTLKDYGNVVTIPENYVKKENNAEYVNKLQDGKQIKQPIKTGQDVNGDTEIVSGLQEGDVIYD